MSKLQSGCVSQDGFDFTPSLFVEVIWMEKHYLVHYLSLGPSPLNFLSNSHKAILLLSYLSKLEAVS
jgi:hypothetical protein